jgi:hypothetical protein
VDTYPDNLVRDLIAHELAHVWQYATDSLVTEGHGAVAENEEGADDVMSCWGFEPHAMDEWDLSHGVAKVIDTSSMTPEQRKRAEARYWSRVLKTGR